MTTPRVTVPEAIEALKHCVENEKAHWSLSDICDPCVDVPVKYLRVAVEHLSAAPAPEGGAVFLCDQCNGDGYIYPNGIGDGHNHQDVCPSCGGAGGFDPNAPALATPAEAGREAIGKLIVAFMDERNGGDHRHRSMKAADAVLSALRAQPPARAWGWDYEICTGCSASLTAADIKAGGHVSCCPDRRMVTVRDLVDAHEAQRKPQAASREDAQPVAWACKTCNSPRAVDPCQKCGTALTKPADGWEWPGLPDIDRIRTLAREVGYAVGVHGTMERDLDLIAAPWVAEAVGPAELAQHIADGLGGEVVNGDNQDKPCGRWSCNIHTPDWTKLIDLSVMPPITHPAPDALRVAVEALEAAKPLAMGRAALSVAPKIIKALAALQAEQESK